MRNLVVPACIAAVVLLLVFVAAHAGTGPASPAAGGESAEIKIENFRFGPQTLTVAAGTKVTWVNRDDAPHTVVGTHKEFTSSVLDIGERYSFTFANPGTYGYFCSLHPRMTGKVIVK